MSEYKRTICGEGAQYLGGSAIVEKRSRDNKESITNIKEEKKKKNYKIQKNEK